jgi:hypothetical protein
MYPATEMALHLGDVCVDQRPALATLRAAIRALHVRHQPAPHHVARAKALAAGQIAGSAGAVSNAREASRPQAAAAEFPDDGRRPPAGPGPTHAPATGQGSALYQRQIRARDLGRNAFGSGPTFAGKRRQSRADPKIVQSADIPGLFGLVGQQD